MSKTKEIVKAPSEEALQALRNSFPSDPGFERVFLPRLGMYSQNLTEGKGKSMKVVAEAGTFFTEHQTDEEDENGKKIWEKKELGTVIEGTVIFQRRQLKFYDGEKYTSSPIYDSNDEVLPLFKDKVEVDRGTPKELQARKEYQGKSAKGKDISKLEENKILYVIHEGELYQMNLRGTSMYAFKTYARSVLPPAVLTRFSSEAKENGSISWSQMSFEKVRDLDADEIADVQNRVDEIRKGIAEEKAFFAAMKNKPAEKDDLDEMAEEAGKLLE